MRFPVDANVPLSVAPRIRALGHEATDVREIADGTSRVHREMRRFTARTRGDGLLAGTARRWKDSPTR